MLTKLLSETDKDHLLELLNLLALADKPLLWDGKRKEEITSKTNLDKLSIQKGVQESALIADIEAEGIATPSFGAGTDPISRIGTISTKLFRWDEPVETQLINSIKTFPLQTIEEPANRVQAATRVLTKVLEGKKYEIPSIPKLMLLELMLMALCGGSISSIEWAFLKEFQKHHQLEDFIFDDLLERAETMNSEVSKTISIILE